MKLNGNRINKFNKQWNKIMKIDQNHNFPTISNCYFHNIWKFGFPEKEWKQGEIMHPLWLVIHYI